MHVLEKHALLALQREIVLATQSIFNAAGDPVIMSTVDSRMLRTAAMVAVQIATGQPVFPGDERIIIERPRAPQGVVSIQE